MPLIPETMVRKMMKGIKTLTRLTNHFPIHSALMAVAGANCPNNTAATSAIRTSRVRCRDNQVKTDRMAVRRIMDLFEIASR